MTRFSLGVAALALAGCTGWQTDNTSRLDGLFALRCAEAQQTITRLRDTADLYDHDDLVSRLQRATRLAEIWCPRTDPLPVPEPPDPTGGGTPALPID